MIALTERSASRRTPPIMSRSCGTKMPARVPSAISDFTSSSLTTASRVFDIRRRRMIAVGWISRKSQTAGAAIQDRYCIGREISDTAVRSGLASAIRFGTNSPMTSDR